MVFFFYVVTFVHILLWPRACFWHLTTHFT